MPILALGISHHTAPLAMREKLAIARDAYGEKVEQLREDAGLAEAVIVSTCNRTELYGVGSAEQLDRVARLQRATIDVSAQRSASAVR